MLPLLGNDRRALEQLKEDWTALELDAATRAMLQFAQKATEDPAAVTAEDINALRAQGLSDAEILDVVLTVAFFNFVNRISSLLGVEPPVPTVGSGVGRS